MNSIYVMHYIAGAIVLVEALNKLERSDPCKGGLSLYCKVSEGFTALVWALLALGAANAVAVPILLGLGFKSTDRLILESPHISATVLLVGVAISIVKSRLTEYCVCKPLHKSKQGQK